jgi:type I restriction enzyme S subunit
LTEWGALFFEHKDLQPWLIKQGVGRYKLRKEKLMEIPMTIPPLDEQRKILDSAEVQRTTSAQAVTKCLEMTELLQERRSALISAAVTGQIDVRGLVLEASEQ